MVGQGHQSDRHEFDPTPGGSGRQEGLVCSGPWGHEESDMTKQQQSDHFNWGPVICCTNNHHIFGRDLRPSFGAGGDS